MSTLFLALVVRLARVLLRDPHAVQIKSILLAFCIPHYDLVASTESLARIVPKPVSPDDPVSEENVVVFRNDFVNHVV